MAEQHVQRRLAAIMAADIVGYSRLMEADEAGTLNRLKALRRDIFSPLTTQFGGRIFKLTGDGALAEFSSAANAVHGAVAIQRALAAHNAESTDAQRLELRIGISLGDVMVEGSDLYGNGVNVAARMEGLADPGGICVSANVHEHVRNTSGLTFADLGAQQVKNISQPVQAYKIEPDGIADQPSTHGAATTLSDKPSIAVLPFDNMSGDPEQEFFVDGLAEDIITTLSKIERMRVIARHSTFEYKGKALDLRRIANDLGVRYVLEGSVRRGGNRLRITAQLIDADDGGHLWAERYDRPVDDLFDIQDEITKEIVTALRVNLTDGEEARLWARGTNNIEAWQYAVLALEIWTHVSPTGYLAARTAAERATQLDPEYALAWAMLGVTYWYDGRFGAPEEADAKFAIASEYADRAMALDDSVTWAIGLSALVANAQGRFDEGVAIVRRGINLYPGNADVRAFAGFVLTSAGLYAEAEQQGRTAFSLNPFVSNIYRGGLARTLVCLGKFEEVLALCDEILKADPEFLPALIYRAYIYAETGRTSDAQDEIAHVRQIAPDINMNHIYRFMLIKDQDLNKRFIEDVRAAGMPD